jgi:hypothetical protein
MFARKIGEGNGVCLRDQQQLIRMKGFDDQRQTIIMDMADLITPSVRPAARHASCILHPPCICGVNTMKRGPMSMYGVTNGRAHISGMRSVTFDPVRDILRCRHGAAGLLVTYYCTHIVICTHARTPPYACISNSTSRTCRATPHRHAEQRQFFLASPRPCTTTRDR